MSQAQAQPVSRVAQPAPAQPAPPPQPKKKVPSGDRSNIKKEELPIYSILSALLVKSEQAQTSQTQRFVADSKKRLNELFELLNDHEVPAPAIQLLLEITRSLEAQKLDEALSATTGLMTSQIENATGWATGIKQLITVLRATSSR